MLIRKSWPYFYKNGTCLKNSMFLVQVEHEEGDTSERPDCSVSVLSSSGITSFNSCSCRLHGGHN